MAQFAATAARQNLSKNQSAILQHAVKNMLGFKELPKEKPHGGNREFPQELKPPKYMLDLYERYKFSTFPKGEQRGNTVRLIYADIGTVNRHRIFLFNLSSVLPSEKVFSAEIHLYKKQMKTRRMGSDISLIMFDVSKVNLNTLGDVFISSKTYGWQIYDVTRALQTCLRVKSRRREHLFGLMFRSGGGNPNVDIPLKKFIRHHSKPFLIIYSNDTQNLTIDHIDPHFKPKDLIELNKQLAETGFPGGDDVSSEESATIDNETIPPKHKGQGRNSKKQRHFFFDEKLLDPILNRKIEAPGKGKGVVRITVNRDDKKLAMVGHEDNENREFSPGDFENVETAHKADKTETEKETKKKLPPKNENRDIDKEVVSIIPGEEPGKNLIMIGPVGKPIPFKKTKTKAKFDYEDSYMVKEPPVADEPRDETSKTKGEASRSRKRRSIIDNEIPEVPAVDLYSQRHRGYSIPITHPGMLQGRRSRNRKHRNKNRGDSKLIPFPDSYETDRRRNRNRKHSRRKNKNRYHKSKTLPNFWSHGRRKNEAWPDNQNEQLCAKRKLQVDFADIGWGEWIISPKSFEAHYCGGSCPFPLTKGMRPTNHATIQSIVHAIGMYANVPAPCCVPDSMTSVTLLYFDESHNVVLKNYPGMSVQSCACR
ncbi:uncharacterized protein LOC141903468 [Tubulanus polymorphus]|uniref:uncharacterized protein LOC141903468 n=1 Tax=Tubulanus polymorphus TaxID=672921 RepID=UPI003DA67BB3